MKEQRRKTKKVKKQPGTRKQHGNPGQITVGWGRGASEYRPGMFIYLYLTQNGEACCADVFYALKQNLKAINRERIAISDRPIRGSTYNSFAKYWHWYKKLGLIEPTGRSEPSVYPFLEDRVFYQLTDSGEGNTAWNDPLRAAHPEFR